jgi:ribokinase
MGRVVVVGSYNVGLTVVAPALPAPGQTVLGHTFDMGPGGKGSNQAIGARRLGADVTLVVKLGRDPFAQAALELFDREGLLGPGILETGGHTGVGLIVVDDDGRNMIAVAPGANGHLVTGDLDRIPDLFEGASHLLCQLECSPELFAGAAERARAAGAMTISTRRPPCRCPGRSWRWWTSSRRTRRSLRR